MLQQSDRLRRIVHLAIFLAGTAAVAAIGSLDFLLGDRITLIAVYLIPVVFTAWYANGLYGSVIGLLGGAARFASHLFDGIRPEHVAFGLVDAGLKSAVLWGAVFLLVRLKKALGREREFSRRDGLTGSYNRRHFLESLNAETARARRYGTPISLLYLDVDGFKRINDDFGHAAGDRVLVEVVNTVMRGIRATDFCGRLGGDEFGVVFVQSDAAAARAAAEKIFTSLRENSVLKAHRATVSVGTATFPKAGLSADAMIRLADRIMYSVKKKGKNGACFKVFNSRRPIAASRSPAAGRAPSRRLHGKRS